MGRHKITAPRMALDRSKLPLDARGIRTVTSGTVTKALEAAGWTVSTCFVVQVWNGHSRALTALGDAIRAETAKQAGLPEAEIWKEVRR